MENTDNQTKNINAQLAENLGAYATKSMDVAGDKKEQIAQVDYKMVTFSLAGKDYALDIMQVVEIVKANQFTYVPNTLPFVLGVYNLRGEIISIIDLRLFFNIDIPQRTKDHMENMLIVRVGEQKFGVVVDAIDKVVGIQKSSIQPPHPLFGDINVKYIEGVIEANNCLYILLDVERIFGAKADVKQLEEDAAKNMMTRATVQVSAVATPQKVSAPPKNAPAPAAAKDPSTEVDYKFIVESLASLRKFSVTPINQGWVKERYIDWKKSRGKDKVQFQQPTDADEFLKPFYSPCHGTWWKKDYADAIFKILPDNTAKQIVVWNPGCGKGTETYSLACLLKKRYPEAKIRIYAHDTDLLSVSNAPLLSVPKELSGDWYAPFLTKKTNGELTFTKEIKDSIMFEYHDCANTNALPVCDIIFSRELVSFLPANAQNSLIADFGEKLKGNGIVVLGQNESLADNKLWAEKSSGSVKLYNKQ